MDNMKNFPRDEEVTLRDRFAMAALQGMLANPQYMQFTRHVNDAYPERTAAWLADTAYTFAYAMLEERDK